MVLVVSCCTKFEDVWSGKCLCWMRFVRVGGGAEVSDVTPTLFQVPRSLEVPFQDAEVKDNVDRNNHHYNPEHSDCDILRLFVGILHVDRCYNFLSL